MNVGRERIVTILVLAGLTGTFVAAVNLPGRRADAAIRDEIARAEAEIARGPLVLERHKAARLELNERLRYLADSSPAVAAVDPHELLADLSRLARSSRLTVRRLEPELDRPRASYTEHPFRLDFRGDLAALQAFLRGLETGPRLFAVEDLEIRRPTDAEEYAGLEGSIRFAVFAERGDGEGFSEESGSAAGG